MGEDALWVLFAQVLVYPDLHLALFVYADHVLLDFEEASLVEYCVEALEAGLQDIQVVGEWDVLDIRQFDGDALRIQIGSVVRRAELLAVVLDEVERVDYKLLGEAPLEGVVILVELLFVVELHFVFLHFDSGSDVLQHPIRLRVRLEPAVNLLVVAWIIR